MARQPYPRTGEVREKNFMIGEPGDGELKNTPWEADTIEREDRD